MFRERTDAGKQRHRDEEVEIRIDHERLGGRLTIPEHARSVVVFAHGSGSSRHSPRNRFVASVLNRAGLATLLFDLLSPEEAGDRANVFDVDLLGTRLSQVTELVREDPDLRGLAVSYFGASTGAAAALQAAAAPSATVTSVVSRGGRPDLAGSYLGGVRAATLFIVGSRDSVVLKLNKEAQSEMDCLTRLEVVPGATHLFEEPGTLERVAELARDWFLTQLEPTPAEPG